MQSQVINREVELLDFSHVVGRHTNRSVNHGRQRPTAAASQSNRS